MCSVAVLWLVIIPTSAHKHRLRPFQGPAPVARLPSACSLCRVRVTTAWANGSGRLDLRLPRFPGAFEGGAGVVVLFAEAGDAGDVTAFGGGEQLKRWILGEVELGELGRGGYGRGARIRRKRGMSSKSPRPIRGDRKGVMRWRRSMHRRCSADAQPSLVRLADWRK